MTTDKNRLARLADIFLDAADFPLSRDMRKPGAVVEDALDAAEKKIVDDALFNAMAKKVQGDEDIGRETLVLADVFCKVAARMGMEKQVAHLVPVSETSSKTVRQLQNAGYVHLAQTVRAARRFHGL